MPRVKRGTKARQRRNKVFKRAKGFVGARSRLFGVAVEAVRRAERYATRDRKQRKRDFRRLWIVRINAAARAQGISYGRLIDGLTKSGVEVDRKLLADLAVSDPPAFAAVCDVARQTLAA